MRVLFATLVGSVCANRALKRQFVGVMGSSLNLLLLYISHVVLCFPKLRASALRLKGALEQQLCAYCHEQPHRETFRGTMDEQGHRYDGRVAGD